MVGREAAVHGAFASSIEEPHDLRVLYGVAAEDVTQPVSQSASPREADGHIEMSHALADERSSDSLRRHGGYTFAIRDEIALLHCAMPEPVNPKPATEDPLLEALRSIQAAAREYPGGLTAAFKSADLSIQSHAALRVHELSAGLADIVIKDSRFLGDVVRMVASVDGHKHPYDSAGGK